MFKIKKAPYRFTTLYVKVGNLYDVKVDIISTGFGYDLRTYICKSCGELFVIDFEMFGGSTDNPIGQIEIPCPACRTKLGSTLLLYPQYVYQDGQILETHQEFKCDSENALLQEVYCLRKE